MDYGKHTLCSVHLALQVYCFSLHPLDDCSIQAQAQMHKAHKLSVVHVTEGTAIHIPSNRPLK